jgi:iron complex outermembrane receptor protein
MNRAHRTSRCARRGLAFALAVGLGHPATVFGRDAAQIDLARASLEELMNINITSASRKSERAEDTAAAVDVLTSDDIRRSGATSLPELLRQIPGVQVAQVSASDWAVSIRGFNGLYANKLLVLVDGRSVYNRILSGVYWKSEEVMVENIDRIEVIRGSGGAVWGANAVNGVINIITKSATATQGAVVSASGGSLDRDRVATQYSGMAGDTAYRVHTQWSDHGPSSTAPGHAAQDGWRSLVSGVRVDRSAGANSLMLDGGATVGRVDNYGSVVDLTKSLSVSTVNQSESIDEGHALARWTHAPASGGSLQVQGYVDLRQSTNLPMYSYSRRTFDLDVEYQRRLGLRHDVVVGSGIRFGREAYLGSYFISMAADVERYRLLNAFVKDEITIVPDRLSLSLGAKVEHDSIAGATLSPTVRAMWRATKRQRVWGAASRASRSPSMSDRQSVVNLPWYDPSLGASYLLRYSGNPDLQPEELVSLEAGYRFNLADRLSVDVAGYANRYRHLITSEYAAAFLEFTPGAPHYVVPALEANKLRADSRGVEVGVHWTPLDLLRIDGGYTAFSLTPHPDADSTDVIAAQFDGAAPTNQWRLGASIQPTHRVELTSSVARVGALQQVGAAAYTRLDAGADISINPRFSILATGQNLTSATHAEFMSYAGATLLIPRSASVRVVWHLK